jgi:thiol-disulfide isomerase/thioredoxin
MKQCFQLLLFIVISLKGYPQAFEPPSLNIGDNAPPLHFNTWLKGAPIQKLEKGKIYVLEFWSTWCKGCIAAMPKLSELSHRYKHAIQVISVDVQEMPTTSVQRLQKFVDSMATRMDFSVAVDKGDWMYKNWLLSSKQPGIPSSVVVNREGKIAWIGYAWLLENVIEQVFNNKWNLDSATTKRKQDQYLAHLDDSLSIELMAFKPDFFKPNDLGKPDSSLAMINRMLAIEPRLKYALLTAHNTFAALLKTNQEKAYEYGKVAITTAVYGEPSYEAVIGGIETLSDKLTLTPKIYSLGAKAAQAEIDAVIYPHLVNMPKRYSRMADWYWRAHDTSNAVSAIEKAIAALMLKKPYSESDLTALKARLQQYKQAMPNRAF